MKYLFFVSIAYSFEILRPLQKAILDCGDEVRWYIEEENLAHYLADDEVQLSSIKSVRAFNPDAIFVPGNWVPFFFPGLKVQVFHGFGIEKKGHFRIRNFFDLYCTHGPITTERFQQLAKQHPHFRVIETGWPKVDPLFDAKTLNPSAQKTILYAPTFSPSLTSIKFLHETIRDLTSRHDWQWVIKFHPKTASELRACFDGIENDRVSIKDDEDILPLMQRCDVMISDTSSVITEFMLLDKPVIAFNNTTPGDHLKNITNAAELEPTLLEVIDHAPAWLQQQREFIAQMHPYHDGRSSQRVLEATRQTIEDNTRYRLRKPLNLFRNLKILIKMRRELAAYLSGH